MADEGRELGWDEEIQNDGADFEPIPSGDYDFIIDHIERGRSKGSAKLPPCNMAIVYFRVQDRDREVTLRGNYILHTRLEWKLSELFCSVGLKKKGEKASMKWSALPGLSGRMKVDLVPRNDDSSKMTNEIVKLYEKEAKAYKAGDF